VFADWKAHNKYARRVGWIALFAWIGVVVFAVIVLGFCAYELVWKSHRLQRDLATLVALGERAQRLQADVTAAQQRLTRLSAG
jgi:membrane-anchored protein YejM (alkaline phosphatase superfamily)